MLAKKFWIPVVCVLIGVAIGGTFLGKHVASQAPVKVINTVPSEPIDVSKPATPKPPPPGETVESGHWHGNEWHADAHETSEMALRGGAIQSDGVWYPDNYTQADIAADLAGEGAATDEEYERRFTKHWVNNYLRRHFEEYPDCTEREAVLADAIRQAEWRFADQIYRDKNSKLEAEFDQLTEEMEQLFDKYNDRPIYESTHIPESERLNDSKRIKALMGQLQDQGKRWDALRIEEPIYPKARHTH